MYGNDGLQAGFGIAEKGKMFVVIELGMAE
jgi:hypothetical protein